MSTNDINTTNARPIDNINHVPCANNNIKCNIHDTCAINYDTCAINYDIIILNKNNHQKHEVEPIPLSNQQNVTTLSKSARTQELLIKEASNIEELMKNTIEMEQLLHGTSTTDTSQTTKPGNETLISVMISSMKQIVDHPKSTSSPNNDSLPQNTSHSTHKVCQYKYASNLNGSKWSTKVLKTKTNVHMQRTSLPGESAESYSREESNIPFTKSRGKYDATTSNGVLSLPTSINGELETFRLTNQDNDHGNDGNYQENRKYWKSHRIIGHEKVDRHHNPYNLIIAWGKWRNIRSTTQFIRE